MTLALEYADTTTSAPVKAREPLGPPVKQTLIPHLNYILVSKYYECYEKIFNSWLISSTTTGICKINSVYMRDVICMSPSKYM
uniref:Uncharacterized protein n=1 Tax=Arundo donax TaxID=35708 RepID=A0A0A9ECR8_ARUDO